MYRHHPQTAHDRAPRSRRCDRARPLAAGHVLVRARRPLERPRAARARRRRADGRRLLLRERIAPRGRRTGFGARRAGRRPHRNRHGVVRDDALPGRRRRAVRGVVPRAAAPVPRGRGRRGRAACFRAVACRLGWGAAPGAGGRYGGPSSSSRRTRTGSSSRTWRTRSRATLRRSSGVRMRWDRRARSRRSTAPPSSTPPSRSERQSAARRKRSRLPLVTAVTSAAPQPRRSSASTSAG